MEIWDAINDTLSVVVWPGVAVIAIVVLREPIGGLISRVRSAEAFGASITLEKVNGVFSTRARYAVKNADRTTEDRTDQPEAAAPSDNGGDQLPPVGQEPQVAATDVDGAGARRDESRFTKSQVEVFIQAAGIAGWDIGTTRMFPAPAEPVVRWTDDNVPEIDHWNRADRTSALHGSKRWRSKLISR